MSGFFDSTDRIYCRRFFAQRVLLVQAPNNNKTIRIVTSVINIVSILSGKILMFSYNVKV